MVSGERLPETAQCGAWFAVLFWLGIGLVWGTAALLPLYPDEIAYRLIGSRLFFDHGILGNIYPACASFTLAAPWPWYPAKLLDYLAFGWYDSPVYYRAASAATAVAALAGGVAMLRKLDYEANAVRLFILLLSLGIVPFSFIMARPEGAIFACFFWLMSLSLDRARAARGGILSGLLFLLLSSILLSSHPKSFLFLPALAILYVVWSRREGVSAGTRIALAAFLLWLTFDSTRYWSAFAVCPDNKSVQAIIDGLTLSPGFLVSDPAGFLHAFALSLADSGAYFKQAIYRHKYMGGWLPPPPRLLLSTFDLLANIVQTALIAAGLAGMLAIFAGFMRRIKNPAALASSFYRQPAAFLGAVLALTLLLGMGVNRGKNFYEVAFVFPILFTCVFVHRPSAALLSKVSGGRFRREVIAAVALFTGLTAALNFLPPFLHGYSGISVSLTTLSERRVQTDIAAMSAACGIPAPEAASHLIVDDLTYQFFRASHKPVLVTWLYATTTGMDRRAFVARFKTSGILARCGYIPAEMKETPFFHAPSATPDPALDVCCVASGYYDAE
jgi:hypothetical protein